MRNILRIILQLSILLLFISIVLWVNNAPSPIVIITMVVAVIIYFMFYIRNRTNFDTFYKLYQKEYPFRKPLYKASVETSIDDNYGLLILTEDQLNYIYFEEKNLYLID